jgi:hypothetical protein
MADDPADLHATVRAPADSVSPRAQRLALLRAFRARVAHLNGLSDTAFAALDWRAHEPLAAPVRVASSVDTSR